MRPQFAPFSYEKDLAATSTGDEKLSERLDLSDLVTKILIQQFTPACIVVDEKYNVLYVHGQTGKYLEPPTGPVRMNTLDMARTGLGIELSHALHEAFLSG